jgi:ADP-ribosylglycohydrolase
MTSLPTDHHERMLRAMRSLQGLSLGDAFGQRFFFNAHRIDSREVDPPIWYFTDDTVMAISVFNILKQYGSVDQDALAHAFVDRYYRDPSRGYGGTAHEILRSIHSGTPWFTAASQAFSGMGSMGNGGAMRVAPLGAYFAGETQVLVEQARLSAEVTHTHHDGQAGAIAIALAAGFAWKMREQIGPQSGDELFKYVLDHTPKSETRNEIEKASGLDRQLSVQTAASFLGSGYKVISQDTVPFSIWCAARHLNNFEDAMWTTVAGLGDRDTTCAIVGGIVALSAPASTIPEKWIAAREELTF